MSLSGGRNKLFNALQVLGAHWQDAQRRWADKVRQDFDENYLAPLEPGVKAALQAMDRLDSVIRKMRQDCG